MIVEVCRKNKIEMLVFKMRENNLMLIILMFLLMKVLSLTTPSSEKVIFDSRFHFLSRSSDLQKHLLRTFLRIYHLFEDLQASFEDIIENAQCRNVKQMLLISAREAVLKGFCFAVIKGF